MSHVVLDPKLSGETRTYKFDFTSSLAVGETLSTQVVTASVYSGIDATPSAIISGVATASGAIVSQVITAGTVGVLYTLLCSVTTSAGQTLVLTGFLAVIPNVT